MKSWVSKLGMAGLCALALTGGASDAQAGTTHYLTMVPGPLLLNELASINNCITTNTFGGLVLAFGDNMSTCPWVANGVGWSAWAGGDVNVPWAPNPSSGSSAMWNATTPANTEFRARVALMNDAGAPVSVGSWVNGPGLQEGFADNSGFGGMLINFQMRSFRATTTSPRPTPILHTVAGNVYSS
jgi:hypothetical protein